MYKYILFSALFTLLSLLSSFTHAHGSKQHYWWGGAFSHPQPCHNHINPNPFHYYWAQFFWWHNHCLNQQPNADAGDNQDVASDTLVKLDGTNSADPDGILVRYYWRQVRGPWVKLSGRHSPSASFTAPDVSEETRLVFRLTVKDNMWARDVDFVSVNISPADATSNVNLRIRSVDGSPVSNAELSFFQSGVGVSDLATIVSGSQQVAVDPETDYALKVNAPGFAVQSVPFSSPASGGETDLTVTLIPRGSVINVTAAGNTSENGADGATVSFNASEFVDDNGNAVTQEIQLTITPVDISQPAHWLPSPATLRAFWKEAGPRLQSSVWVR
ncbi:hypothetical protein CS022_13270 [Veronia nyctiphanis]|uniref:Carboxypeptidase regulatory-like domain-containing protein n=1 Tax=Veronia nyctiphanis TaxID=1278244 RepID=A0A4Q0YQJ3_9GAMM|nr:hypothetical protein [Veronia nyctiphanis]RXJ72823.1 hypothetical protein CS022_13270 [Veronia nyctiphanis]